MLGIVRSLWAGWWTWWVGLVGGVGTPVGGRSRLPQPPCFLPPSGLPVPGHWRSWLHQEGTINTLSSLGRTTWSRYWQSLARLGWFGSWEKLTRSKRKDATDRMAKVKLPWLWWGLSSGTPRSTQLVQQTNTVHDENCISITCASCEVAILLQYSMRCSQLGCLEFKWCSSWDFDRLLSTFSCLNFGSSALSSNLRDLEKN